jgi:AcrR family transcriptional regulator
MAKPSKSDVTRQRVLDAAAWLFRRHGYAAITLKDIAARAQMQAGSLYYHVDTKEDLVGAVLAAGVDAAFAATREAVDALGVGADPLARLRTAIAAHLRVVLAEHAYASANLRILGQVPDAVRERHLERQREYGDYWRGLFKDAAATGALRPGLDLSVIRMLTLGALNWSVEWYRDGGRSPNEIAAHAATLLLDGLIARAPGRSTTAGQPQQSDVARAPKPRAAPGPRRTRRVRTRA